VSLTLERADPTCWYARSVADEDAEADTAIATERLEREQFEEQALALADDVWRVARRLARTREEAEDLVQEAYVRAFRSWRTYQPGTNLRAWLLRIVHNLAIDASRRRKRTPDVEPLEANDYYLYNRLEQGGGQTSETDRLLDRLSQGPILDALHEVPQNFREVVVLVDLGDFSYQEAADVLGVPIGTVMSRLHRGRRMLKAKLADVAVQGAER
jgi:RNA polymerase sigma-70 factor (ECF subfamily)